MNLIAIDIGGTTIKIATWINQKLKMAFTIDTPDNLDTFVFLYFLEKIGYCTRSEYTHRLLISAINSLFLGSHRSHRFHRFCF